MSNFEMMRGKALLQNLNNARIRHSRARQTGSDDAKTIGHEVSYLQAMWREHVKKSAVLAVITPQIAVVPIAA